MFISDVGKSEYGVRIQEIPEQNRRSKGMHNAVRLDIKQDRKIGKLQLKERAESKRIKELQIFRTETENERWGKTKQTRRKEKRRREGVTKQKAK